MNISMTELQRGSRKVADHLRAGGIVNLTHHGFPFARIIPITTIDVAMAGPLKATGGPPQATKQTPTPPQGYTGVWLKNNILYFTPVNKDLGLPNLCPDGVTVQDSPPLAPRPAATGKWTPVQPGTPGPIVAYQGTQAGMSVQLPQVDAITAVTTALKAPTTPAKRGRARPPMTPATWTPPSKAKIDATLDNNDAPGFGDVTKLPDVSTIFVKP